MPIFGRACGRPRGHARDEAQFLAPCKRAMTPAPTHAKRSIMPFDHPAFVEEPLDRHDAARRDPQQLAAWRAAPAARFVLSWRGDMALINAPDGVQALHPARIAARAGPVAAECFLGVGGEGPVFGLDLDPETAPDARALLGPDGAFVKLRDAASGIPQDALAILGVARSLAAWHSEHRFCARCGAPSDLVDGGWKRRCPACGAEHFPRVNPVVILLVTDGARMMLGRPASWPPGMFSCIAGFVEPGETLFAAAKREAKEEADLTINALSFVMDQPWPFPSSLMVGLQAQVADAHSRADGVELETVRWFDARETDDLLNRRHPDAMIPPDFTIAQQLIRRWRANLDA